MTKINKTTSLLLFASAFLGQAFGSDIAWNVENAVQSALYGALFRYEYADMPASVIEGRKYIYDHAKSANKYMSDMLDDRDVGLLLRKTIAVTFLATLTEKADPDGALALIIKYNNIIEKFIQQELQKTAPEDTSLLSANSNRYFLSELMGKKESVESYLYIRSKMGVHAKNEMLISFSVKYTLPERCEEILRNEAKKVDPRKAATSQPLTKSDKLQSHADAQAAASQSATKEAQSTQTHRLLIITGILIFIILMVRIVIKRKIKRGQGAEEKP